MSILRKLRTSSRHGIKEENEYAPGELFEAVRWAFGPDFALDASPPAHVTNCQRLVEAWRAARAASPSDKESSRRAEAAAAEFRAWLEVWEHGRHSDWERLPLEVMEMIFTWLPGDELQHLLATRLVCRAWHEVTSEANQPFWRRLFVSHRQLDDSKARQQQSDKKEARRQEYLKLLQIAMRQDEDEDEDGGSSSNNNRQEEEEEEEVCWKRRYFEVLHGVDMSEYEEYETKGFRTKLINGPRPGKSRPNYGRSSSSSSSPSSAKQRKRELERQQRRDRRSRYQARANAQGRAAKRDASW
ncbi:Fbox domain containing protein [Acanthamoeba castellanii str. Neff]|uniref:Fbox domain containing protein n=1 Tax=Acanthamoeba castellanii (strain ATCC 30010 / Neff) TaxID=1257118 RepID=L8HIB8_ACACF|nr:Fbox domain containing protein [Acanthamoeba castellanii str. Neff]ELR24116.1 Fbox domain containing protein [Acanthamoeba castellanii str. Neff]